MFKILFHGSVLFKPLICMTQSCSEKITPAEKNIRRGISIMNNLYWHKVIKLMYLYKCWVKPIIRVIKNNQFSSIKTWENLNYKFKTNKRNFMILPTAVEPILWQICFWSKANCFGHISVRWSQCCADFIVQFSSPLFCSSPQIQSLKTSHRKKGGWEYRVLIFWNFSFQNG